LIEHGSAQLSYHGNNEGSLIKHRNAQLVIVRLKNVETGERNCLVERRVAQLSK